MTSGSSGSSEGGNTNPPLSKRIAPAKAWCWTLNNYTIDEIDYLVPLFQENCEIAFFAEEVGESGTPHLQGYLKFKTKARPMSKFPLCDRIHWERARATLKANMDYCSKEHDFFFSLGLPRPVSYISESDMYPYQLMVRDIVTEEPDDRTIHWFYGGKNIGKTKILKWLCGMRMACVIPTSKRHALSQVYKTHEDCDIYCMNLTADESKYQCNDMFSILEAIKDEMFSAAFGTECNGMCLTNTKHVIIMANEPPDLNKTEIDIDRFKVYNINKDSIRNINKEELSLIYDSD